METTLYDDSNFRSLGDSLKPIKRPVTLDLDSPSQKTKKQKFSSILTSPDLNLLKLASPELERFIITQNGAITTTPTPTQFLFPKNVTEEQEKYAKGFVDALALLHQGGDSNSASNFFAQFMESVAASSSNVLSPISSSFTNRNYSGLLPSNLPSSSVSTAVVSSTVKPSSSSITQLSRARPPSVDSTTSNSSFSGAVSISTLPKNFAIKEELQTVPSDSSSMGITPPLSPINLEDQERIKLERKRYRNRIAASKCRQRKLERIARLEEKVSELKTENTELGAVANRLREQVCSLKQEVLDHVKQGCQIMVTQTF